MTRYGRDAAWIGAAVVALAILGASGGAPAAPPPREDVQRCNERAAQASARTQKSTTPRAAGPHIADSPPRSDAGQTATPGNPAAGGRREKRQPGEPSTSTGGAAASDGAASSDELLQGMAPAGQADPTYRHSYLVCLRQLGH